MWALYFTFVRKLINGTQPYKWQDTVFPSYRQTQLFRVRAGHRKRMYTKKYIQ